MWNKYSYFLNILTYVGRKWLMSLTGKKFFIPDKEAQSTTIRNTANPLSKEQNTGK